MDRPKLLSCLTSIYSLYAINFFKSWWHKDNMSKFGRIRADWQTNQLHSTDHESNSVFLQEQYFLTMIFVNLVSCQTQFFFKFNLVIKLFDQTRPSFKPHFSINSDNQQNGHLLFLLCRLHWQIGPLRYTIKQWIWPVACQCLPATPKS